ncbi:hypothetical protein H072_1556 [Dactylellina haptotyla CBS 200.50]|uniref:GH16 domain-containing protein n=1 Tax=Dactylellina haptotyla (strain CBS 200.50) TaxID=1284197 RepID=S8BY90_DACHA|nr:hypothetical protein H072_1556 [Dactylellina haptotyla CBS 200.50]
MKFATYLSAVFTALFTLLAFAQAAPAPQGGGPGGPPGGGPGQSGNVKLYNWRYWNGQFNGNIWTRNFGPDPRRGRVEVWAGQGNRWDRLQANYYGPANNGYSWWSFNGQSRNARQFYVRYEVNRQSFQDPPNGYYFINGQQSGNQGPPSHNGPPPPPWHNGPNDKETKQDA